VVEPVKEVKALGRPKKMSIAEKEEKALQRELNPPEQKKAGRPKGNNYLPYPEAREVVRAELLHSRGAFEQWHDREKPKTIPRYPYRVYIAEWTTWGDFLGTNNEFKKGQKAWRSYKEAIHIVHALKLKTQKDWLQFCSENPDAIPDDIPRRPDVVYNEWAGWNQWLGNKPVEAIQAKIEAAKTAIYYIIHTRDVPGNVFTYGVEPGGMSGMKDRWEREPYDIVKMFWYEQDRGNEIKELIGATSTPYLGDDRQRITPNVWMIIERLQQIMHTADPRRPA
jgi:hypothetical protein